MPRQKSRKKLSTSSKKKTRAKKYKKPQKKTRRKKGVRSVSPEPPARLKGVQHMKDKHRRSLRSKNKNRILELGHVVGIKPQPLDTRADIAHRISRSKIAANMAECVGVPKMLFIAFHIIRKPLPSPHIIGKNIEQLLTPEELEGIRPRTLLQIGQHAYKYQNSH